MVAQRVDRAQHVHDVGVLERADYVDDRVHLADVRQELVAQALALRGAFHEPRDVDELDHGGDLLLGLYDAVERLEAGGGGPAPPPRPPPPAKKGGLPRPPLWARWAGLNRGASPAFG